MSATTPTADTSSSHRRGADARSPARARRARRRSRTVVHGIAHVHASFNNTHVTITDLEGNVVAWSSVRDARLQGLAQGHALRRPAGRDHRRDRRQGLRPALARHPRQGPGQRPRVGHPRAAGGGRRDQVHPGRHPDPAQRLPAAQAAPRVTEQISWPGTLVPVCRLCRREGMKLFLKGDRCFTEKCAIEKRNYAPGQHGKGGRRIKTQAAGLRPAAAREAEGEAPLRHAGGPVRA